MGWKLLSDDARWLIDRAREGKISWANEDIVIIVVKDYRMMMMMLKRKKKIGSCQSIARDDEVSIFMAIMCNG
jgi:hypothetical protein